MAVAEEDPTSGVAEAPLRTAAGRPRSRPMAVTPPRPAGTAGALRPAVRRRMARRAVATGTLRPHMGAVLPARMARVTAAMAPPARMARATAAMSPRRTIPMGATAVLRRRHMAARRRATPRLGAIPPRRVALQAATPRRGVIPPRRRARRAATPLPVGIPPRGAVRQAAIPLRPAVTPPRPTPTSSWPAAAAATRSGFSATAPHTT